MDVVKGKSRASAHPFVLCSKSNAKVGAGAVDWSRGESSEVDGDQLVGLEFRPLSTPPLHVHLWNKFRVCLHSSCST